MAVRALVDFEAAATGPGRSAGGTVTLTPLGAVLAESVFSTLSPPVTDTAEDMVTAVAWLPPKVALIAAAPWLAARTPYAAVRELLEFAVAFDGPMLRFVLASRAPAVTDDRHRVGQPRVQARRIFRLLWTRNMRRVRGTRVGSTRRPYGSS